MKRFFTHWTERRIVAVVAFLNLLALYVYGLCRCPGWTLLGTVVFLMLALHQWPEEK